jgi:hypothetical protein
MATIFFQASPAEISKGGSSLLNWVVSGAAGASIDNGIGSVALTGSHSINPVVTTSYTLSALGYLDEVHYTFASIPDYTGTSISFTPGADFSGSTQSPEDVQPAYDSNPIALYLGEGTSEDFGPCNGYVFENGTSPGAWTTNSTYPLDLTVVKDWNVNLCSAPRFLGAWSANALAPSGTILFSGGSYYVQYNLPAPTTPATGSSLPALDDTVGNQTTDGTCSWYCTGTSRPVLTSDMLIGMGDFAESYAPNNIFSTIDPTQAVSPTTAWNFIGFRYLPEPAPCNGNVGDVHWMAYVGGKDMTPTVVDTGITPDNGNNLHLFGIQQPSLNNFVFLIDGVQVATITAVGLTNKFFSILYRSSDRAGLPNHTVDDAFTSSWFPNSQYGAGAIIYQYFQWTCVQAGVTGTADPLPVASGFAFDSTNSYTGTGYNPLNGWLNDCTFGGIHWMCLQNNPSPSVNPPDPDFWQPLIGSVIDDGSAKWMATRLDGNNPPAGFAFSSLNWGTEVNTTPLAQATAEVGVLSTDSFFSLQKLIITLGDEKVSPVRGRNK